MRTSNFARLGFFTSSIALTLAGASLAGCAAQTGNGDDAQSGAAAIDTSSGAPSTVQRGPRSLDLVPELGTVDGAKPALLLLPPRPRPTPLQTIRQHARRFIHAKPANASPTSTMVPYRYGLSYGLGIDSPSGTAMNLVATGAPTTIAGANGQNMTFTWTEITSQEDLMSHLGISADASAGIGLFSASARMSFSKDVHVQSNSVFAVIDIQIMNAFSQIDAPNVSTNAATIMQSGNMTQFQGQFGDKFVRGLQTGGAFLGTVEIETSSQEDKQSIESSLSGAYLTVNGSVSLSDSFSKAIQNHSVHVQLYTEGGTPPTPLPTDPVSLLNAANKWIPTVAGSGAPYMALVDGDSILPLPNPPTYIDLQQQEDVLTQCSLYRNADMQTLNDIAYAKGHPDQFVNGMGNALGPADIAALDAIANKIATDMTAITQAADKALNDPAHAALPQLSIVPPAVLPVTRVLKTALVAVPNLIGMYPPDASNLLTSIGLAGAGGSYIVDYSCSDGDVYYQSPAAGTPVPKGTGVWLTICRNPNQE